MENHSLREKELKEMFIFGLTRRCSKQTSIPHLGEGLLMNKLLERIVEIHRLVEKTLDYNIDCIASQNA